MRRGWGTWRPSSARRRRRRTIERAAVEGAEALRRIHREGESQAASGRTSAAAPQPDHQARCPGDVLLVLPPSASRDDGPASPAGPSAALTLQRSPRRVLGEYLPPASEGSAHKPACHKLQQDLRPPVGGSRTRPMYRLCERREAWPQLGQRHERAAPCAATTRHVDASTALGPAAPMNRAG